MGRRRERESYGHNVSRPVAKVTFRLYNTMCRRICLGVVAGQGIQRLGTAEAGGRGGRAAQQMEKEVAIVDWVVLWLREEKGKKVGLEKEIWTLNFISNG